MFNILYKTVLLCLFFQTLSAQDLCHAVRREWKIPTTDSALVLSLAGTDTVFVKKDFDLSRFGEVRVNACVYSSGATLSSRYTFGESQRQFSGFLILGKKALLSGLRIIGHDSSHRFLNGVFSTGIFVNGDSARIENCVVYGWGYCNIWLRRSQGVVIEACEIGGAKLSGYGYGIWLASNGAQGWTTVRNNTFTACREALGSSGANCWAFSRNTVEEGCGGIERHNSTTDNRGGLSCIIDSNYFYGNGYEIPVPLPDSGNIYIRGNYFTNDSMSSGIRYSASKPSFMPVMYGNHYGGWLPDCFEADSFEVDTGRASIILEQEETSFTLSGSRSVGIRCYQNGVCNLYSYEKFTDPDVLCASVKLITDCPECYKVQLLIDDTVRKEIGPCEWTKWTLLSLRGSHKVALRLICIKTTSTPVFCWLDDFDCAGKINNSGFENGIAGWRISTNGNGANFNGYEKASGNQALFLRWISGAAAGQKCGVSYSAVF